MSKHKKSKPVHNKKQDKRDITIKLDKFNVGRIPIPKATKIIQGKKYDKKGERKRNKLNLKKYIG